MRYDYLLVVGPGRSGSEFLYDNLRSHPDMAFPEIRGGRYYQSLRRFNRTFNRLNRDRKKIFVDITVLGYHDSVLDKGIEVLKVNGYRILLMVILRDHCDRALSMMRFRRSRGEKSALLGTKRLEQAVVQDRLTRKNLVNIYGLDVDVLTVNFPTLTTDTTTVLDTLASICGISKFELTERRVVNESVRARNIVLSTFGKSIAIAMRRIGFKRLLQRLKDSQFIRKIFFVPLTEDEDKSALSEKSKEILEASFMDCCSIVENSSEKIHEGIYFRNGSCSS